MSEYGNSASEWKTLAEISRYAAASDREGLRNAHDRVFQELAAALVGGRISGPEFEQRFLEVWRIYRDNHVATSSAVDTLFTDVDAYCGDPDLWEDGDLDDEGLRGAATTFLETLR